MTKKSTTTRSRCKNFTGEKSATDEPSQQLTHSVEEFAVRINASWQKLASSIIATGRLCAEAQEGLMQPELDELKDRLNFCHATFSKLAKIGSSGLAQLKDADAKLPPSLSMLYELTHLGSADIMDRIKRGKIHPEMKRDNVLALNGKSKEPLPEKPVPTCEQPVSMGEIFRPASTNRLDRGAFIAALKLLREQFEYELLQPDYLVRLHETRRWIKIERRHQELCKKRAAEKLAQLVKERTGKKRVVGVPNWKAARFSEEEVTLFVPCSQEDIDSVFGFLGISDECEALREQAEREVPEDKALERYDFFDIVDPNPLTEEELDENRAKALLLLGGRRETIEDRRERFKDFK